MEAANIREIKNELLALSSKELTEICLRLARFRKDNKELLTYLLFEAHDEEGYISSIKDLLEEQMTDINRSHIYYVKKSVRKTLRSLDKYIRYSQNKQSEVELRIHFLTLIKEKRIPIHRSRVLQNMVRGQVKKIMSSLDRLHEDLQFDYQEELKQLSNDL